MEDTTMEQQQEWVDQDIEKIFSEGFLPNFYIPEQIKTALLLQLIAPEPINILLLGDPAIGKTTILKEIAKLHEKSRYYEGVEYLPLFSPSIFLKGTLADVRLLCFNKLDRVSAQDRQIIADLMGSGIGILASGNPKFGRFDACDLIADQIDLPPSLISRFDLVFPMKDLPNREKDEQVVSFILDPPKNKEKTELLIEVLRKEFAPQKQINVPKMTSEAIEKLKEYYLMTRHSKKDGRGITTIPITARQVKTPAKLSKAMAIIRKSSVVTVEDAEKAISLMDYCLHQIAKDPETGKIDIDRLSSSITATQRSNLSVIKEIMRVLEEELQRATIPIDKIKEIAQRKNIPAEEVEEALDKLMHAGDIFEPKRGFVQKL